MGVEAVATVDEASASDHPRAAQLRAFIDTEYRQVVGAVSLITGDRWVAEDAVQDALVTAWRKRDQQIERLGAWITVVATNAARSTRRRANSESRALERVTRTATDEDGATDAGVQMIDPQLVSALGGLPLRERQAAVLFYVNDLSVRDVGEQLGISEGSVKTLLSRARQHLAVALRADDAGGER